MSRTSILPLAAAATVLAFAHPAALAEETRCVGTIGAAYLDNIFVPDGARCVLDRTRAKGNVVVGTGATLIARSVMINGSVQAEGAASVRLAGASTVGGSVQIVQGGAATILASRINGDLQFDENVAAILAERNVIGGNLQAVKNYGGVTLNGNRIKGDLQCKENIPAPTGTGNVAASKEGQCRRL